MEFRSSFPRCLLTPPAATILLYAADGLSVGNKHFSVSGRPKTPNRSEWVPMFRTLVNSPEGIQTLQTLAEIGMKAWDCPSDTLDCLKAAFRDITIRALLIASLENFADTAREKVVFDLPQPARPYPPPPQPPSPKPERPRRTSSHSPSGPHRPSSRLNNSGPRPG